MEGGVGGSSVLRVPCMGRYSRRKASPSRPRAFLVPQKSTPDRTRELQGREKEEVVLDVGGQTSSGRLGKLREMEYGITSTTQIRRVCIPLAENWV
jgi:hypothetical protein